VGERGASLLKVRTVVIRATSHLYLTSYLTQEFANSLQTSFGNLGVSLGTATGGWFISHYGIAVTPWVGIGFGFLALVMMLESLAG
jgi:predicted MFS family arabinose efflux permease